MPGNDRLRKLLLHFSGMKDAITKNDAAAFKARWAAVNAAEVEELRTTSMEQKARQLAASMLSVRDLGWTEVLEAEEAAVRALEPAQKNPPAPAR